MSDDILNQIKAERAKREQLKNTSASSMNGSGRVSLVGGVAFDQDIYDTSNKFEDYVPTIGPDDEEMEDSSKKRFSKTNKNQVNVEQLIDEARRDMSNEDYDPFKEINKDKKTIAERENEYQARRRQRMLSPERVDAFKTPSKTEDYDEKDKYTYSDAMRKVQLERKEADIKREIIKKKEKEREEAGKAVEEETPSRRRRRWDIAGSESAVPVKNAEISTYVSQKLDHLAPTSESDSDLTEVETTIPKKRNRWDQTPRVISEESSFEATPKASSFSSGVGETPRRARSRWDETPVMVQNNVDMYAATPVGDIGMATPMASQINMGQSGSNIYSEQEFDPRNRYMSDEELDQLLPSEGYEMLAPPEGYMPIRTPARKLMATPTPMAGVEGFAVQEEDRHQDYGVPKEIPGVGALPFFKQDDVQFFGKLLDGQEDSDLTSEEAKDREIKKILLRIKNGTPAMRKTAMREVTDGARGYGAGPLFNNILPLLMAPSLEDQERHLLVKVIDRILYKLGDLVRPFTHKILVVIEPLLIDEDYYARVEGREIISNLSKAAGLATMIATMRPDIDHIDEYVRNTTARAFSVVASALGIAALLPFLKAVCKSKKSWQARHTGIKIVQQIAILMGSAILPHLRHLVECVGQGLVDEQQKVRTITALALAALAEGAAPYGIESFDSVLKPLWMGTSLYRGKGLAAFLKAIGFIIPLMDSSYANYYTREVMKILIREFRSPDEEMKKIVLKVVKQCAATNGVEADYISEEILPEFFKNFWVRRMALDRRNYLQVVETTVELANKVGVSAIMSRIVDGLKDESEPYRKMVMEALENIVSTLGATDIDPRLEERLMDGVLYAFQEQQTNDPLILNGFGTLISALGEEYPEVLGSILGGLKAIVNVIGMTEMNPPIKDLLPRLTPILKNRHEKVQENCIDLVGRIADRGAEYVSAREWMRICFELLELLKAHKKAIRRAAVNTFGYIAKAIGPQDVLATLLNNLKVQERQNRVCTTVAIAIVAESCAPYTVLPALMNEYRVPEMNVQNGVLKSMSFLFEYIGEMGKDYINAATGGIND
ncbi:hypothetical protein BB559_000211 [Furculomyces boomerangus]|uniref:Uncharacterized protein n=2 Tax=Harpellales TaxID=61421 RepID=A0A2T9Z5S9_9FUNG|nr:hypothetical protein BB559_000211 [Furculomyces boomerangus]PWA01742.1 hypothetical protein BB558_002159 [Smittium angustum]